MSYKDNLVKIQSDFKFLSAKLLKIKDKRGNIVPFVMNNAQEKVYSAYKDQLDKGLPIRLIILKARQEGISTLFEGIVFQRNSFKKHRKAVIIGHIKEASNNLFDMFKRYYNNLPEWLKPELRHSNEKKLSYAKLDSEIVVYTAENGEVGRSATIQDLHATEVTFWRNAKTTMVGLLQTVPEESNTMVILESTANGVGGWFYNHWKDAVEGRNDYTPIFLAWFDLPEYTREFKSNEEKKAFQLNSYEKALKEKYNLTLEQINWYRYMLKNKLNGDEDSMKQEYPSFPEEAFIASGRPVFDANKCLINYNNSKKGERGELLESGEFIENPKGFITLHRDIIIGKKEHYVYAAGVDVAEGLEQGDYSVIKVLDRRLDEVVLTWHGHIDPDLLACEMLKIQKYLKNEVYFEVEKNNHGLTTIVKAYELGVNIKYAQDFSKGYTTESHQGLGFTTNSKTKPLIIGRLAEWIRDDLFKDREQEFWSECLTFVRDEKGRMAAQNKLSNPGTKTFDDRVMASALMINCSVWMPNYWVETQKKLVRIPDYDEYEVNEATL